MVDKFQELILYLARKSEGDPNFGVTKLNKLLFFCDFLAYRMFGQSISNQRYFKLPYGPCPRGLVPALRHLEEEDACVQVEEERFGRKQQRVFALRDPRVQEAFSSPEVELIDDVLRVLWDNNAREVSQLSHTFIGWRIAGHKEDIPYETVFLGDPETFIPTDDEIEYGQELAREIGAI